MNRKKSLSRVTSMLLCIVMLLGMLPVSVFAATETAPDGTAFETGNRTASVESSTTYSTEEVPIYKLVTTPESGKPYLIVNSNNGTGYGLNNSTTGYAVSAVSGDGYYITWDNDTNTGEAWTADGTYTTTTTPYLWTATSGDAGWSFKNANNNYLGYSTSSGMFGTSYNLSTSDTTITSRSTWTLANNNLYFTTIDTDWGGDETTTYRYIAWNSGISRNAWSIQATWNGREPTTGTIYFYEPVGTVTKVTSTYNPSHLYTVEGTQIDNAAALADHEVALSSTLFDSIDGADATEADTSGWDVSYTLIKDDEGVIYSIDGSTATMTGKTGTAVVKVTYTKGDLTAWDEFLVTAKPFECGIDITVADTVKNDHTVNYVTNGTTLTLGTAFTSDVEGWEPDADNGTIAWTSSDESIATVDADGKLTFTGTEGTTTIKVTRTFTVNGEKKTLEDEIVITAVGIVYQIDIVDPDNENASIDETIVIKGLVTGTTPDDNLAAVVTYKTSDDNTETVENPEITWISSNTGIATVDEDGVVTFVGGEGTVQITARYTYADGKSVEDVVTYSVSKSENYVPEDGTNDFPEYPNEGAIRIDKNATAVGNFSETGVAKVELSMTGVPYSVGNEIDVVIMLDMSSSMNMNDVNRVDPARTAALNALEAIVKNENDTINNNRVALFTFNGYDSETKTNVDGDKDGVSDETEQDYSKAVNEVLTMQNYQNASNTSDLTKLNNAKDSITSAIDTDNLDQGTNYGAALEKCYSVLNAAREEYPNRKQFVIFITDGEPTTGFAYETEDGGVADDGYNSEYANGAASQYYDDTEYYSKQMRNAGVEVYAIGIQLPGNNTNAHTILKKIGGNKTGTAYANSTTHGDYAQFVGANEEATKLIEVLSGIVNEIKQAATDVTVTDKITDEYTMILQDPANVTTGATYSIDVIEYTLDANKNRVLPGTVIESVSLTDTSKVTTDANGNITKINAENFTYDASTRIITWTADKLDTKELALSYYVYLNESAGYDPEDQTAPGTYPTNEYAHITYTNHLDHECKKVFPKPQMTWNGAQVSYTFYLVNSAGQPVNRAGRVVPFAEAVYVTDVYTESVTWDTDEDKQLSAEMIAADLLPDVYELYDEKTAYTINVYENEEGKDLGNHFIIAADKTTTVDDVTTSTTKVFNTKAGTIYSAPGTYNKNDVHNGFDFANTTVAFAVTWNPALVEDTVVIDFGLPVVIDVTINDAMASGVVGVRTDAPNVSINNGQYTAGKAQSVDVKIGNVIVGTASVENKNSVRFTPKSMQMSEPVVFYYESDVEFYNEKDVLQNTNMYSSVTVIPATSIYYEDAFVLNFNHSNAAADVDEDGKPDDPEGLGVWHKVGNTVSAKQDVDRPGPDKISSDYDADNIYGYDSAYKTFTQYSLGSAMKVTVDKTTGGSYDVAPSANFTFTGTGFDIISLTDNDSGTIVVSVYKQGETNPVKSQWVNNYYGYNYDETTGEWIVDTDSTDCIWQVPVMKIEDLDYGTYDVKIQLLYLKTHDIQGDGSYSFCLDAIRIYDPAGADLNGSTNVGGVYDQDGELNPSYIELRDLLLSADQLKADGTINGAVFIDGKGETTSASDYANPGPNNETYLAPGQGVYFTLTATGKPGPIHIGAKLANGSSATLEMYAYDAKGNTFSTKEVTLATATDLYYELPVVWTATSGSCKSNLIYLKNASATDGGMISITNLKAVNASWAVAESISISGTEECAVGATSDLTAIATYTDGTTRDVTSATTWTSSNTGVATVEKGVVTGVAAGSATITAKSGTLTNTYDITVSEPVAATGYSLRRLAAAPVAAYSMSGVAASDEGVEATETVVEGISKILGVVDTGSGFHMMLSGARGHRGQQEVEAAPVAMFSLRAPAPAAVAVEETEDEAWISAVVDTETVEAFKALLELLNKPAEPEVPETPETPDEPVRPNRPGRPSRPSGPALPEKPSLPDDFEWTELPGVSGWSELSKLLGWLKLDDLYNWIEWLKQGNSGSDETVEPDNAPSEVFEPEYFTGVLANGKNGKGLLSITTSQDVEFILVNGQKSTQYTDMGDTYRLWTVTVNTRKTNGAFEVIAYNADGAASESIQVSTGKNR